MSEAVAVAIVAVASTLFLAAGGALWRLASQIASQREEIKTLRERLDKLDADVEDREKEDAAQWQRFSETVWRIAGRLDATPAQPPPVPPTAHRRSRG